MSASFRLTLDTHTALAAAINGGKATTENAIVTLELALEADAESVKIWGSINPLDPMNAGMAETEADAEWLPASPDFLVALTTNPGLKELHVRVLDDVGNEATSDASITLGGEGPTPPTPEPVHPEPLPATGLPEPPRPAPERRRIVCPASPVPIRSRRSRVLARCRPALDRIPPPRSRPSRITVMTTTRPSKVRTRVETSVHVVAPAMAATVSLNVNAAEPQRRDGDEFIARLIELGIL